MKTLRWIFAALPFVAVAGHAEDMQHELLVFGSGEVIGISDGAARSEEVNKNKLSADILFSLQHNSLRLFGEYLVSNVEHDLERFQIGWEPTADTVIWLGRYHQPGSAWNHDHHHGQFLQTSITRPAIDNWEDNGGIVPQHFSGTLVESSWHLAESAAIHTAVGGGIAPIITTEGLVPYDLVKADSGPHNFGVQGRIAYQPDEFGDVGVGLIIAYSDLAAHYKPGGLLTGLDHVDQTVFGMYASGDEWWCKLSGAVYYISAKLIGTQQYFPSDRFLVGYVQAERKLPQQWVVFARHEDASRAARAAYLNLFPDFAATRSVLGLRWEFFDRQAATMQVSSSHTVVGGSYRDVRLQWSAAFF